MKWQTNSNRNYVLCQNLPLSQRHHPRGGHSQSAMSELAWELHVAPVTRIAP
jgi:hypothetical protein